MTERKPPSRRRVVRRVNPIADASGADDLRVAAEDDTRLRASEALAVPKVEGAVQRQIDVVEVRPPIVVPPSYESGKRLAEFDGLADDAPLLLLPVRLETIYAMDADPPELRIRIYPDQLHVLLDHEQPSAAEVAAAEEFWRRRLGTKDPGEREAAWLDLTAAVGARRAGHIARLLEPSRDGGELVFPAVANRDDAPRARLRLLPDRWVAIGYHGTAHLFTEVSRPVNHDITTGLDPDDASWTVTAAGVQVSRRMAWMVDYDQAVKQGMAITVSLGTGDELLASLTSLVVIGVRSHASPEEAAAEVQRLLEGHLRSDGLAFVPSGSPTNNTDTVAAGWSREERELADLADRELETLRPRKNDNATRLAEALGLADSSGLRRAAFGTSLERVEGEAMRRVLFESVAGTMLRDLLAVDGEPWPLAAELRDLRDWMTDHVAPAGPLPAVRIGPQPYGVLPVSVLGDGSTGGVRGAVERFVAHLRDEWRRSLENVPALDPNKIDTIGDGDPAHLLPTVLASQPDPARIFSRRFYDDDSDFWNWLSPHGWYVGLTETAIPIVHPELAELVAANQPASFTGVTDQIDFWAGMHEVVDGTGLDADTADAAHQAIDSVLIALDSFEPRQRPLRDLDIPGFAGVLGDEVTTVIGGRFVADAHEWRGDRLVQAADAADGHRAPDYLKHLLARLDGDAGALPAEFLAAPPLLYQLLDTSFDDFAGLRTTPAALEKLAALEPDAVERLFRQTLGLATHRLDAWGTSTFTQRLDAMRAARPQGVNVGAYGWVVDLERGTGKPSRGFVHAPSLAHATTAAVLRSAWHAHGIHEASSPAAVNADSKRVREAAWLLDGVRNGQSLGELLGYRFERLLHEAGLAGLIRDTRSEVLEHHPDSRASADEPIDGLDLLSLWRDGGLDGFLAGIDGHRRDVEAVLTTVDAGFDAVADVAVFESTHALLNANVERAAGFFEAMSYGTHPPPELRGVLTGRAGTAIEHRMLVLLDAAAAPSPGSGWAAGLRDRLAMPLERWLHGRLPAPASVRFTVSGADGSETELTLASLGLSALDALALTSPDATSAGPAVTALAGHAAGVDGSQVDAAHGSPDGVSLEEFQVLTGELKAVLESARLAGPQDLRPAHRPGEDAAGRDGHGATLDQLAAELRAAAGDGAAPPDQKTLAHFGVTGNSDDERRQRAEARLAGLPSASDDLAAAAQLFGTATPVLASFDWTGADAASPPVALDPGLASESELAEWLDAVGKVRDVPGRLAAAALLGELIGVDGLRLRAGQDVAEPGERWAGCHLPPPRTGGRLCISAVVDPDRAPALGGRVAGLVLDRWSERIPTGNVVTGVAVHHDGPSTAPPQAWLLAVPPEGRSWSLDAVTDVVHETLEWAQLRAVQPEDLGDYGQAIPMSYAAELLVARPEVEG